MSGNGLFEGRKDIGREGGREGGRERVSAGMGDVLHK